MPGNEHASLRIAHGRLEASRLQAEDAYTVHKQVDNYQREGTEDHASKPTCSMTPMTRGKINSSSAEKEERLWQHLT